MYFIVTTKEEDDLQPFFNGLNYKWMDSRKLQKDFNISLRDETTMFYDFHLNRYITTKLLNSFKNYKAHYFVYRVNDFDMLIIENLKRFIFEEYGKKFEQLLIVDNNLSDEEIKQYDNIDVDCIDPTSF